MQNLFPFIRYTKFWIAFSLVLIFAGFGGMALNQVRHGSPFNMGIDFTGGTLMEFRFENNTETLGNDLGATINAAIPDTVSQITKTDQDTYLVHGRPLSEDQLKQLQAAVGTSHGQFEMLRFITIGPKIGASLQRNAAIALLIAFAAIVFYIAYAFRHVPRRVSAWRFGICAIIALIHDVLVTLGVFALMNFEVDALFITALLTIIGFSVHDTIVVFDRIRENLKNQGRDQTFGDIADISLNQTLGRSINTSVSTLFPLVALYFLGAPSLQVFVFALIVGIVIGTYSSIFIASPLLTLWEERQRVR